MNGHSQASINAQKDDNKIEVINWNQMSELGLIERINREVLHPLGLAISRDVETGVSAEVLVADDGVFNYPEGFPTTVLSDDQVKEKLAEMSHTPLGVPVFHGDAAKYKSHKPKPSFSHGPY